MMSLAQQHPVPATATSYLHYMVTLNILLLKLNNIFSTFAYVLIYAARCGTFLGCFVAPYILSLTRRTMDRPDPHVYKK